MLEWVNWLFERGILGGFAVAVVLFVWKYGIPWGERYVQSKEKLDERLGTAIEKNTDQCGLHGEGIVAISKHLKRHDTVIRSACAACREVAQQREPGVAQTINRHCAEIERIIGEA